MHCSMMADIARAEASKDGHIAARIIFPNGTQVIRQLPLLDRDGDDMTFGEKLNSKVLNTVKEIDLGLSDLVRKEKKWQTFLELKQVKMVI
ncbi:uncharacterized protein LOC106068494 isoform X3 [Biomphalaria glabrata]|uniref:Uncharacterized protein LOC106068494 isoform X3 n=1 Tax=Biomphalaria glabrata TaxID=6526 RepID=A0A9W2YUP0_BIOGL|nr:uncharacterized protein LOC106068494 isoform X3 [Biomphalaria glabrata]XP_055866454.1 uncharacterized protein LOC106068494 isoform X3 [Biomphalaria glabrata]XP_055866455.1 uncharacterized protein LOC106068494 isoform X3 [Biomphalaria glabrata]